MIRVELSRPSDWESVGARWRALEPSCDGSFFQSWTWLGCMAERRFPDPLLLQAFEGDRPVGMALFNRRRGRLHLSETGEPVLDSLTVEHNGVLAVPALAQPVRAACIGAARKAGRLVVMSGVGNADRRAALETGAARTVKTSPAPYVDLDVLRAAGATVLDSLSANTRYQIGRSDRRYAQKGPLAAERAPDEATALICLGGLIDLHTASWTARGKPGAFASPLIRDFHRELISRGFNRGEVDIWRITTGAAVVGFLYNFKYRRTILSYQGGFSADHSAQRKPGLTCHALVIQACLSAGAGCYDFLAGDHQYKRSFSNAQTELHWLSLAPPGSVPWLIWRLRNATEWLKTTP